MYYLVKINKRSENLVHKFAKMITIFVAIALISKVYGEPVACCTKVGDFIADSHNLCKFYQCEHALYGVGPSDVKTCGDGATLKKDFKLSSSNPCVVNNDANVYSCYREYDLYVPKDCPPVLNQEPGCFGCSVELGANAVGGFRDCKLEDYYNQYYNVDRWHCPGGKCFIRIQIIYDFRTGGIRKFLHRGCAKQELIGPYIDTSVQCQYQQGQQWYFCDGHLCNKDVGACGH